MKLDIEATAAARQANPHLTPYDTGEVLIPLNWVAPGDQSSRGADDYGKVDFDTNEGQSMLTVLVHPSALDDDTTVVEIDTLASGRFKIVLNDSDLYNGNPDEDNNPVTQLRDLVAAWQAQYAPDNGALTAILAAVSA